VTTDGGSDERKAASQLTEEGCDIYCVCHLVQLCVNDVLDRKKSTSCAWPRSLVQKAHDLVVFVNSHKNTREALAELTNTKAARSQESGEATRGYKVLVLDQDTRWDSELRMMERLVYFDEEIMAMYTTEDLGFPDDLAFSRDDFDLLRSMVQVLLHVREFTKFFEQSDVPTLAHVPGRVDDLLSLVSYNTIEPSLTTASPAVRTAAAEFCKRLSASIKDRFQPFFEEDSLALAARLFLPGPNRMTFKYFPLAPGILEAVKQRVVDEISHLRWSVPDSRKPYLNDFAAANLKYGIQLVDTCSPDTDPLDFWSQQKDLAALWPVIRMLLAVPASSAHAERAFSSAGFTLDEFRMSLEEENFRREHRLRRYLTAGAPLDSASAFERADRALDLITEYAATLKEKH